MSLKGRGSRDAGTGAGAGAMEESEDRDRQVRYRLMSVRNSSRVFCCVRKQPSMQDVTVIAPGFWTPRMVMHMCLGERRAATTRIVSRQRATRSGSAIGGGGVPRARDRGGGGSGNRGAGNSRRFHYDGDATGVDGLLYGERDLLREPLLDLQPATKRLRDPRELREAEDELVRDVGYRDLRGRTCAGGGGLVNG